MNRWGRVAFMIVALMSLILFPAWSCKKSGGQDAPCSQPADCQHGFRCENGRCLGGVESACGYIRRCLPKMEGGQAETLFGESWRQYLKADLEEGACEAQLRVVTAAGRAVVMSRACGPRIGGSL
jgi:hypothetical protein